VKFLKQGLCLALLGAGLSAASLTSSSAAAPAAVASGDDSLVSQIRDEAQGQVFATRDTATGEVSFLRSKEDLMPGTSADSAQEAGAKADAYVDKYAGVFGATADQLSLSDVRKNAAGWTVEFTQSYQGVPVFGAELHAQVDNAGQLTSVNGFVAPDLKGGVDPGISAAKAGERAVAAVRQDPPGGVSTDVTGIEAASSKLFVYREGAIRGVPGANVLAYVVEVTNKRNVRDMVFINADTGKIVNRYSMIHNALERELYEESFIPANLVWEEGDAFPGTLLPDQVNEVNGAGESYWLYENAFDYESYDGADAVMRTVNNDPTISCPNANWNGVTTNYCDGVTSDDTVSHEWGHAYTEYTSGLVYQWQPGAMNEAYSDIWGETVDQINTRFNEVPNTPRTVGQCSAFTRADVELEINAPAPIAGPCDAAPAGFGPVIGNPGFTDDVVVGEPVNGCTALTNAAAVSGKFVYVDRGTCSFDTKADFAEAAGATGIIVGQNIAGPPSGMAGTANIPGLMITQAKGADIKAAAPGTVNATMHSIGTDPVDNSYRWLSGEGDPAFGGAIRDMWNPNCYGDPAKVTDAEYHCTTDDSGGVHTNSGVVNHTYALMVDGGTYNSVTVPAIGLDKAANLFWQAQTAHLGPISDFVALADSLEASCTELTGVDINIMDVTPNAGPTPTATDISAADCAAVTSAIAATELRTEPVQCNFQPLLQQGAPALTCGAGTTLKTVYTEDFEDGLAGWASEAQIVYPGGFSDPWLADNTPPGGHTGGTARGVDDDEGACTEAAGDISSRDSIISPVITMPTQVTAPKLSFEHYVATEGGYDGGNVKVSINGGAFTQIPQSAFVFNPYNSTLLATNPLGGQTGFTGTDGGEPSGSWGTTIVNLGAIGVTGGTQVRLRLDMGRDGCGGLDGWYVDNIKVTNCEPPTQPPGTVASTTKATADPKKIERNRSFKVKVTVAATGATPAGTVEIYKGTKLLATGTLGADGKVTIKVSKKKAKKLKKGKNVLTAKYLGSATVAPSQDDFVVKVIPKKS
jgi:Zn-dependent metalloprotease